LLQKLDLKLVKKLQFIDEEIFVEVRFEVDEKNMLVRDKLVNLVYMQKLDLKLLKKLTR
jgi:hypothetical protein